MNKLINHAFSLVRPSSDTSLPIVVDSPHSGLQFPTNSGIVAPVEALKTTWDAYVDELWQAVTNVGGSLLAANFPRAYIDANRAPDDIDQSMLDEPWPTPLSPSAACLRGMGLIRLNALPGVPMYNGKLPVAEVKRRLDQYYFPYHETLRELIDAAHAKFGQAWHIDCHSMKSVGNAMNVDNGAPRPDIVVSDRNGTTSSPEFTEWVAAQFDRLGYSVLINTPYQGGHIVHKYGAPVEGRHSVQVEIKRSVYMDEKKCEKTAGFDRLQRDLETILVALARYVEQKTQKIHA